MKKRKINEEEEYEGKMQERNKEKRKLIKKKRLEEQ